ncbi:hypothetical protein [Serratia proteamaculans]
MPANELKPCPFCGDVEMTITPNQTWTGMRYVINSYTLRHFCSARDIIHITRNTEAELMAAWCHRHKEAQHG